MPQPSSLEFAAALLALPLGAPLASAAQVGWQPTFGGRPGLSGDVSSAVQFDDGSGLGPKLVVSGVFEAAGGVAAYRYASWDGSGWSSLGDGQAVWGYDMVVFDDGSGPALYSGGLSGPQWPNNGGIVRWDGSTWGTVGATGTGFDVFALAVFDDGSGPALFAAGDSFAKFDGVSWNAVGGMLNDSVTSMVVYDDGTGAALYLGGDFTMAGSTAVNHIAKWDGSAWSALGSGADAQVLSLALHDDGTGSRLYAGGSFDTIGGIAASRIAAWDGSAWASLGAGITGANVRSLMSADAGNGPELFVGGSFSEAGGLPSPNVASWNGTDWTALGTDAGIVEQLVPYDAPGVPTEIFACGLMEGGMLRLEGSTWQDLPGALNHWVTDLHAHDDGSGEALYVAGYFSSNAEIPGTGLVKWNGVEWSTVGTLTSTTFALGSFDDGSGSGPELFAARAIWEGSQLYFTAKWDGNSWTAVTEILGSSEAFQVHDDGSGQKLFIGGSMTTVAGAPVGYITAWDGSTWFDLAGGVGGPVCDLEVFDDGSGLKLYAALGESIGSLETAVMQWDGTSWTNVGPTPFSQRVNALAVGGNKLYAGGIFTSIGGVAANGVASWDGVSWSPLGTGTAGFFGEVETLLSYDDGSGPAIVAGGAFLTAGGLNTPYLARWNGSTWSGMGQVGDNVFDLEVFDDGSGPALFAGGRFASSSGGDSYAAKWSEPRLSSYCTAGVSASGCQALLSGTGAPSASASSGFELRASDVEGAKDGLFFFGTNGRQANPWGSSTSYQCVIPPVVRAGLLSGTGTSGQCDGALTQDLNALWCPTCPRPTKNPGAGSVVQAQLWYRDPFNTSNQTTSLSGAVEFTVIP